MGEIKSVKVDNWGVFFLQKLQNFFNKTDYCDLTLQFRDNSQLKVHRLVLSACTDYFNVLEQTCDIVDDALIMPNELQADVVVPIVNFMYTGTLEFELKMYGKLLRTAKEMNMTVLLKLLEAHRRTMEGVSRAQRPPSPKGIRRRAPYTNNGTTSTTSQYQQTNAPAQRRIPAQTVVQTTSQQVQRRTVPIGRSSGQQQQQQVAGTQFRQQIGGVSIVKTNSSPIRAQYGNTTIYETQRDIKQEDMDYDSHMQEPASPFEQLRKGYNNTKRPPTTSFVSPPAKKPNLEDVKEFAEQQRMRKQIAAEYGEDQEAYDNMLDDDIHNDDDDDEMGQSFTAPSTSRQQQQQSHQQQQAHNEEATTTITFKHESGDKPPTIVVKDSSNSKMNHAKIIQEVLRQYPHLVKSNKNIKLKILPSTNERTQRIVIKKEGDDEQHQQQEQPTVRQIAAPPAVVQHKPQVANNVANQQRQPTQQQVVANVKQATPVSSTPGTQQPQKRRIDSKTMHSLIALGAENTTGPWLCLRCGVDGRPISIPSYRGFRRHLINTHKEHIDAALCEHCGWRSQNDRNLHFHIQTTHKIKSTVYTFEECSLCAEQFEEPTALQDHMLQNHPDDNKQQCIYCNKIFAKEMQLYNHMRTLHKVQAIEDGIIDETDEEFLGQHDEDAQTAAEKKVQILSDVSLPTDGTRFATHSDNNTPTAEYSGENDAEHATTNEVSTEPKFVTADGSEVILTDEQRKQIMSQLNQEVEGGSVVMFLNEPTAEEFSTEAHVAGEEDAEMEEAANQANEADKNDIDDSQIYDELNAHENANKAEEIDLKNSSQANPDESKESIDNLEWAENLLSAHDDMEEEATSAKSKAAEEPVKTQEDISKKLKELTGDWSDEDDMDDEMVGEEKSEEVEHHLSSDANEQIVDENKLDELVESAQVDESVDTHSKLANDEMVEDDIDLALKNLHKDDTNETAEEEQQSQQTIVEDEEPATEEHHLDESSMPNEEEAPEEVEPAIKEDLDAESEFIKEDDSSKAIKKEKHEELKTEEEIAAKHEIKKEEKLEESNDILLDDLMNDAVGTAVTDGDAPVQAAAEADTENENVESLEEIEEELQDKDSTLEKPEADVEIATAESRRKEGTNITESQSTAPGAEKIKSLISEWVDEDDDGEEHHLQQEQTIKEDKKKD